MRVSDPVANEANRWPLFFFQERAAAFQERVAKRREALKRRLATEPGLTFSSRIARP
jgi:hypothetical protein